MSRHRALSDSRSWVAYGIAWDPVGDLFPWLEPGQCHVARANHRRILLDPVAFLSVTIRPSAGSSLHVSRVQVRSGSRSRWIQVGHRTRRAHTPPRARTACGSQLGNIILSPVSPPHLHRSPCPSWPRPPGIARRGQSGFEGTSGRQACLTPRQEDRHPCAVCSGPAPPQCPWLQENPSVLTSRHSLLISRGSHLRCPCLLCLHPFAVRSPPLPDHTAVVPGLGNTDCCLH